MRLITILMSKVAARLDEQGHGSRLRLADRLKIKPQMLNRGLNDGAEPGGNYALQLQVWLADSATTTEAETTSAPKSRV